MKQNSFLILGATGSFGAAITRELLLMNQLVYAVSRKTLTSLPTCPKSENLKFTKGDILEDIMVFQTTCHYIVFAVNVPYHLWEATMEKALSNCILLAKQWNAAIIFPGNVYSLQPIYNLPLNEDHILTPITRKGKLRVKMENMLKESKLNVLLIRANDYYGPTAHNGMLEMIFHNPLKKKKINCFGKNIIHEWVYLPDLAKATVLLLEVLDFTIPYQVVHFQGTITLKRNEFMNKVAMHAAQLNNSVPVKISPIPWFILSLYSLIDPVTKELLEMKYLFNNTLLLDNTKLKQLLPEFKLTDVDEAIHNTLEAITRIEEK